MRWSWNLGVGGQKNVRGCHHQSPDELNIDGISADQISNMAILICVIGGIIMIIAGIGCCGAMKNVKCLLGVFFIAMLLISILVIVVAVLVHVFPGKLTGEITKTFKK